MTVTQNTQSPAQDDGWWVFSSHSEEVMSLTVDVVVVFRVDMEKVEVRTQPEYFLGVLVGKGNKRISMEKRMCTAT